MSLDRSLVASSDDDGTGATGTILNDAWWDTVLNMVDARWSELVVTSTGTQNNLSITSSGIEADVLLCGNASDLILTGIAAPASPVKAAKPLVIYSLGAGNIYLVHQSGSSSAANRLINTATTSWTPLAAGKGYAVLMYDAANSRWRLREHEQGGLIGVTFAAGDFTGNNSMTWTVASGDRQSGYLLRGNRVHYSFTLSTTTVGGTPSTLLQIGKNEWGGFDAVAGAYHPLALALDNGTSVPDAYCYHSSASILAVSRVSGPWAAATDTTSLYGSISFQVV